MHVWDMSCTELHCISRPQGFPDTLSSLSCTDKSPSNPSFFPHLPCRHFCSPRGKYSHLRHNQKTNRKNDMKNDFSEKDRLREGGKSEWKGNLGLSTSDHLTCSLELWRSECYTEVAVASGFHHAWSSFVLVTGNPSGNFRSFFQYQ